MKQCLFAIVLAVVFNTSTYAVLTSPDGGRFSLQDVAATTYDEMRAMLPQFTGDIDESSKNKIFRIMSGVVQQVKNGTCKDEQSLEIMLNMAREQVLPLVEAAQAQQ